MDLENIQTKDVKIDHEYLLLVTMGIDCVVIEVFVIVVKMDFAQFAAEFDLVVVFGPIQFVAIIQKKKCKINNNYISKLFY